MSLRVSQVAITLVLLNEFDAPATADPAVFVGDKNNTALDKAQAFLATVPVQLAVGEASATDSDPEEVPNDADPDD